MANTVSPESSLLSPKNKNIDVIGELLQGYRSASQLKFLLQKPFDDYGSLSAHQHLAIVLRSFTHSLSLLTSSSSDDDVDAAQNLVVSGENEPPLPDYCLDRKSPDESKTRGRSAPATKSRRGCYKRRRTEQTWTVVSSSADDNHAWRKYGQKEILTFKFPRSYMRCTRKCEQGCRALKQVQRIQEKPELYQITYIGDHTCKDILKTPQVVTDSGNNWESFLAADSKIPSNEVNNKVHHHPIKQERRRRRRRPEEETPSDDFTDSSLDPSLWSDLKDLSEAAMVSLGCSDDNNNADTVYSCSGSLDFGVDDSVHFGSDDFHFDG